jgi:hypothetical protein
MMKKRWRRGAKPDVYEYVEGAAILAVLEAERPPNNSHMAIWLLHGFTNHWPTKRDAQRWVEAQVAKGVRFSDGEA